MHHFPLFQQSYREILSKAEKVLHSYNDRIKINIAFGFILENITNEELKFFHPSNNTLLFSVPRLKNNHTDIKNFYNDIVKEDAFEYARINRPSTNWLVSRIICVRFEVYKLIN